MASAAKRQSDTATRPIMDVLPGVSSVRLQPDARCREDGTARFPWQAPDQGTVRLILPQGKPQPVIPARAAWAPLALGSVRELNHDAFVAAQVDAAVHRFVRAIAEGRQQQPSRQGAG